MHILCIYAGKSGVDGSGRAGYTGPKGGWRHGTAFDQAGKGTASELSLINAIDYAILFANNRS